jgi:3-deoxy-D-manno-octulosonic acid kinase
VKARSGRTFPGFEVVERHGARVLARPEAAPWVRFVLESGRGLHSAASVDRAAERLEGRDPVFIIPARTSGEEGTGTGIRWAVRHYTRGGRLVPALLGDRYLFSRSIRPFHEVEASEIARSRGIQTPKVMAAAMYPAGIFYRADLVTEFVADASDLVETLFESERKGAGGAGERLDALRAAGELVARMAAAGLRHRDMHARNVLLEWQGAAPTPHLLDLDRCDVGQEGGAISPTPMHQRLRRSLRKWERKTGIRISEREWATLDQAVVR